MTFGCVVEGLAEYRCIPTLLGRRGHTVIGVLQMKGGNNSEDATWQALIEARVLPRVRGMALKAPDRVLVVLDREGRQQCCPDLASYCAQMLNQTLASENITCNLRVVVCDRKFENAIFADVDLVDRLKIVHPDKKFSSQVPATIDGVNVLGRLDDCLVGGKCYDKVVDGLALVRKLNYDNPVVLQRSRCLRKLISET